MIRRAAEVLKASFEARYVVARIGGDEFVVIMPKTDQIAADEAMEHIQSLVNLNNKYYRAPELSLSTGAATSQPGLPLEKVISLADNAMYYAKGEHHKRRKTD